MAMAMAMVDFLRSVDEPPKSDPFIERVVKLLAGEGLELNDVVDLDGLSIETLTNSLPGGTSAALVSFISRAIKKVAQVSELSHVPSTPKGCASPATPLGVCKSDGYEDVLEFFAKKKAAKKVHVLIAPSLKKISLDNLDEWAWPQSSAMNVAATEASRRSALLVEAGSTVANEPFVCVDLRSFEPLWCKPYVLQEEEAETTNETKPKPKSKQRQSVPLWSVAYDKWAIFASARKHLSFAKCLEHKEVCQKVAFRAPLGSKPRKAVLGVIYDELARKKWAASSMQDTCFQVDAVAGSLDDDVLREAEVCFDFENRQQGKGDSKGYTSTIVCYKCGKPGHLASECFGNNKGSNKGSGKAIVCYKCGEVGHKAPECTKQGSKRKWT